jgi:hypothetical protein
MTNIKMLSAAVILAFIASPVFAGGQGAGPIGPGSRDGLTPQPGPIYHGFSESLFSPNAGHRDTMNRMNRRDGSKPGGRSVSRRPPS